MLGMRRARLWLVLGAAVVASCSSGGESNDGGTLTPPDGGADAGRIDITVDGGAVPAGTVRLAVPAYYAPGPAWDHLIASAPTVGMIVFNPASGPGTTTNPAYTDALARAKAAGISVLGYVATSYGARAESDIIADINSYYDLYAPAGIYFAEGPMDTDCTALEDMYHRMALAVRARDAQAYLAVGTRYCPTYIVFFDMMVQFARNWTEYQNEYTVPSWMPANSPQRFIHFINSVPAEDAGRAMSLAVSRGAGWVYVTDGADPNPWGALPPYFDAELAALK
jgi:hypothetical protein